MDQRTKGVRRYLLSHNRPMAEALPAVRWRLENLARRDGEKRTALLGRLGEVLGIRG
jgi:hypothetical protein